jgi:ATP-binding cassette subfamily F protein 3
VTHGDHVSMAFFSQESARNLGYGNTIWEEVQAVPSRANDQERRNLLGWFLFSGDDIYKQVGVLSGGEKSRLALLKIMLLDTNFLILDEPTNHLDIKTKDVFQNALIDYSGTVAIVSHDRYFLDHLVNRVFELSDGHMTDYRGNYSYFIEKRAQMAADAATQRIADAPTAQKKPSLKEQKRLEAEERNKRSKVIAALKKELAALEEKIAGLEARKSANEEALCNPQSIKDPAMIKDLHIDLNNVEKELEDAYLVWTDLASQIDEQI